MTSSMLHPTAVVDSRAVLHLGVEIGPYAVIGPHVTLGAGTTVGAHAVIDGHTTLGRDCRVFPHAMIGQPPQDLKFRGERTYLKVGDRTVIREFATLNLATEPEQSTLVGSDCLLMAYSHVAHNCDLGDHVILANSVNLAGHVTIEDYAIIGGMTPIHQFVTIGCHAFVGGASRIPQDVAPYTLVAGNPAKLAGLNRVGLERRGFSPETLAALKLAFRIMFRSDLPVPEALERAREQVPASPEVAHFLAFFSDTRRGVSR
jgi:UDP-N-acetylglucosamine acyltransferase